jgi:fibro-slime domain-containing protein
MVSTRHAIFGTVIASISFATLLVIACGNRDGQSGFSPEPPDTPAADAADAGAAVDASRGPFDGGNVSSFGDVVYRDTAPTPDVIVLPDNFVPTEHGGYALGEPITGSGADAGILLNGGTNCSLVVGVVRDFRSYGLQDGGHPDFERFAGGAPTLGLVEHAIGSDRKPQYGAECDDNGSPNPPCVFGPQMTTKGHFDQWYRFTPLVNSPYLLYVQFAKNGAVYTFESTAYFPLDDAGFGNTPGFNHNFNFTSEFHLKFSYKGGETFSFSGDDDVWAFIDGKLAMDLGGLHTPATGTIHVDTLGLTVGKEYDIELFHAERHSSASNFRADTNLTFTNCGSVPPEPPPK